MPKEKMIEVEKLGKNYGDFKALRSISFDVPKGQVLGFLGPNGAGKTTTMKILTCFMAPSMGVAKVAGYDVVNDSLSVRKKIGYLPEDTPIYPDMTVLEYLHFVGDIRGIDRDTQKKQIAKLVDTCGLMRVLGKPIAQLSKGLRQRAGLAQAMIHNPDILILDEPTSGLDPNQIVEIRELIKEIGIEKTVILSTHILSEVQATCGRVIIINEGELVADGTPSELAAKHQQNTIFTTIETDNVHSLRGKLKQISGVIKLEDENRKDNQHRLRIEFNGENDIRRDIFQCVKDNDWILLELMQREGNLEDIFRKLTRD